MSSEVNENETHQDSIKTESDEKKDNLFKNDEIAPENVTESNLIHGKYVHE